MAVFYKKIAAAQGVGSGSLFKTRILRASFLIKRSVGADRVVKILGSLNDVDFFDLALTFTFDANNLAYAKFEGLLTSLKADVSGGTTGTYDFWMGGSDS